MPSHISHRSFYVRSKIRAVISFNSDFNVPTLCMSYAVVPALFTGVYLMLRMYNCTTSYIEIYPVTRYFEDIIWPGLLFHPPPSPTTSFSSPSPELDRGTFTTLGAENTRPTST